MAPPWLPQDVAHRLRRMHPAGPAMRRALAAMDGAPAGALRDHQDRRLRLLVRLVAARSPFYRRFFAGSGVDPSSIRGLDDLSRLPLIGRGEVMAAPEDFAVYPIRTMWAARSSGTSGRPLTTYRTPGASAFERAALQRQWSWFGVPRDARRVVLRGSDFAADDAETPVREIPGDRQLLVSSFHLTPGGLPAILDSVRAFSPDAVEGWPSSIALLAGLLRDAGERLPVRAVITSSEVMTDGQRALMTDVFDAPVVDHYGQTERVVLAGGCEAGGYHVFDDYGIAEFLPTGGGRSEVVGTALHNWGYPLLRYRTGDEVGPVGDGPCGCGRAFTRIGAIDGRSEDSFTAADGRVIPLPSTIVDDLTGLLEVQVAQLARGRFEVRMVPGAGFDAGAAGRAALRNIERLIGPGQQVEIRTLDRLPRTPAGKLKTAVVEGTRPE